MKKASLLLKSSSVILKIEKPLNIGLINKSEGAGSPKDKLMKSEDIAEEGLPKPADNGSEVTEKVGIASLTSIRNNSLRNITEWPPASYLAFNPIIQSTGWT